ncbi:MAG TPA: hypothetical protein VF553_17645 [Pyrinomonadaceae bacterium]|jgi:hypothetical protein
MLLDLAAHYDFELAGRRMRLWKRLGESYEHVLMKALGYAMFVREYPSLEIERRVGLRYKPDLVAQDEDGRFLFWGECGANSVRKTAWLLKHAGVERLVLFKIERSVAQLAEQLRHCVAPRHRPPGRVTLVNFHKEIIALTTGRRITRVPKSWYAETKL